ncbi:MAG: hypothetical protein IPG92_07845 [Flavobacteriales bacterium]|nr:hypothetical protein [Flavobacteriales bacterium]
MPTTTIRAALFLLFIGACGITASAQSDTTTTAPAFRPTFGLGAGMFAFYGDVGSQHDEHNPLVTRLGYELRASTPITPWLEADLYALHGRLGVNERSLTRNLNFESRITVGGFQLRYNFLQLLNPKRQVEPYINLGFESVEFLTKTDLYDGAGRQYNYWSDGTIRDLPENAPNARRPFALSATTNTRRCARAECRRLWQVPGAHMGRACGYRCAHGPGQQLRPAHWYDHALHLH